MLRIIMRFLAVLISSSHKSLHGRIQNTHAGDAGKRTWRAHLHRKLNVMIFHKTRSRFAKGHLLHYKRTPFTVRKDTFYNMKEYLSQHITYQYVT